MRDRFTGSMKSMTAAGKLCLYRFIQMFSPVAHSNLLATRDKIFRSGSGSVERSAFAISIVGMIAWWSVTFCCSAHA